MSYLSPFCNIAFKAYHRSFFAIVVLLLAASLNGCATKSATPPDINAAGIERPNGKRTPAYNRPYKVKGRMYYPLPSAVGYKEFGIASWYGSESGNRTAMGTRFLPDGISAAHKTLPLPSKVRVTNLNNGRSILLVVNDRGPFKNGRLIDLSQGAARQLGIRGLARVKVEYVGETVAASVLP